MVIRNIAPLTKKIARGAEGGLEFARICRLLMTAEFVGWRKFLWVPDDASGDFKGADGIVFSGTSGEVIGFHSFQFKFVPSPLNASARGQIKASFFNAVKDLAEWADSTESVKWILVTPEDIQKGDADWLFQLGESAVKSGLMPKGLVVEHWGHTRLIELCLKHMHLGRQIFPDLFVHEAGEVAIIGLAIDHRLCQWKLSEAEGALSLVEDIDPNLSRHDWTGVGPSDDNENRAMFEAAAEIIGLEMKDPGRGRTGIMPDWIADAVSIQRAFQQGATTAGHDDKLEDDEGTELTPVSEFIRHWPLPDRLTDCANRLGLNIQLVEKFSRTYCRSVYPAFELLVRNGTSNPAVIHGIGVEVETAWSGSFGDFEPVRRLEVAVDHQFRSELSVGVTAWEAILPPQEVLPGRVCRLRVRQESSLPGVGGSLRIHLRVDDRVLVTMPVAW